MKKNWKCLFGLHNLQIDDKDWAIGRSVARCLCCNKMENLKGLALAEFIRHNPSRRIYHKIEGR